MKKSLSLTIPVGLLTILFIVIGFSTRTTEAASNTLNLSDRRDIPEQAGPPWYDENWLYRREVIVTNAGSLLSYYHVLVKLDVDNFDFSRAKADGSDIRFTDGDGKTLLAYWIEAWDSDNQLAYAWVKVPRVTNGDTVVYLYYDNPDAVSISDGTTTFDLFDDYWCQFPGAGCKLGEGRYNQPFTDLVTSNGIKGILDREIVFDAWQVLTGAPTASEGILTLPEGTGIRTVNSFQYGAVGFRANYGLGMGKEWAGFINGSSGSRTVIGDLVEDVDDLYLIDRVTDNETVMLPRVDGIPWHEDYHNFEVRWSNGLSSGDIDHGASTAVSTQPGQVPTIFLPVTFYSDAESEASLLVDYVYIRQYRSPEPSVTLGVEQGLNDLAIGMTDSPDPLYAGETLTYLLTITNTSNLDAPGVVVTDTLPVDVIPTTADPSQGECSFENGTMLCSLGSIPANSTASVTLVVTTTMDGTITNLANVGSPGYDSNMSNNATEATTVVIPSADLAVAVEGIPEALLPGGILVYNITVTNQGPSEAMGISMIDTLPGEVNFIGTDPESCTLDGLEVTCPLGILSQAGQVQIVITTTVAITQTMELINTATTSSDGTHDPDLVNNTQETTNLVDLEPPEVSWERPVHNGDTYFTFGGMVTLEASATDNDQVNQVRFLLFDHVHNIWVTLGVEYDPPYQVPFDSDMLQVNELYQVFAQGYDRVGNYRWERIFIERFFTFNSYMPLVNK